MENQNFKDLGIKPEILEIIKKMNFKSPTPIQSQSIPIALKKSDLVGIAQTGTGKTFAFGLPIIQNLINSKDSALIILPTRELAMQVRESLDKIARSFNLNSAVLIGGDKSNRQIRELKKNPRIIIATPGRLIDHSKKRNVDLRKINILVLDEADRMFDMGFAPQIEQIIKGIPRERQTMLFSATMPPQIMKLAEKYMQTPLRVEVAPAGSTAKNVTHEIFFIKNNMKMSLIKEVLDGNKNKSILIFSRTKFGAKKIAFAIRKMGYTSTEIHSNRTLGQRMNALKGFKTGKFQVMVATDIAARGIDVKGIDLVINYDLPDCPEDYVHRIGRTGRAEDLGHAISFATPGQKHQIKIIERLIKKNIPVSKLPELKKLDSSITKQSDSKPEKKSNDSTKIKSQDFRKQDFRKNKKRKSNSDNKQKKGFYSEKNEDKFSHPKKKSFGSNRNKSNKNRRSRFN